MHTLTKHKHHVLYVILTMIGVTVLMLLGTEPLVGKTEPVRKIVIFQKGMTKQSDQEAFLKKNKLAKVKSLALINGVVITADANSIKKIANTKEVLRIDEDVQVSALMRPSVSGGKPTKTQPPQTLPWGVDKIDAENAWKSNTGASIKVGIVDTGIDLSHPDLKANIKGGANMITPAKNANDDNGHGTHVAGIVAAANNTVGVVGVSPASSLYAIKVLDRNGSGYLSDIIEGLQWSITNKMDVINMSLGTSSNITAFHDAIIAVNKAGITQVVAAGNSGGAVLFPGAYPEVITVSATDASNTIATWSSRGSEVDVAAPGVSISSTYKASTYAVLSGTSMAAPHVTGTVSLIMKTPVAGFDANSNGRWDPTEVQKKLESQATDLGATGKDSLYGSGLVNAYSNSQ